MKEKAWAIMEEKDAQLRAARVSALLYRFSCQPCRDRHCMQGLAKGTSGVGVGRQRDVLALQAELNHTTPDNGGMESPLPLSHSASLSMSQPASGTAPLASSSGPEQQAPDQQPPSSSSEQVRLSQTLFIVPWLLESSVLQHWESEKYWQDLTGAYAGCHDPGCYSCRAESPI